MAQTAARALKLDAWNLLRLGVVDGVIQEPEGSSRADHHEAAERVAGVVAAALRRLAKVEPRELVDARRHRFRSFDPVPSARRLEVLS